MLGLPLEKIEDAFPCFSLVLYLWCPQVGTKECQIKESPRDSVFLKYHFSSPIVVYSRPSLCVILKAGG